VVKRHPDLTHDQVKALASRLWPPPVFDCRLAAALLLEAAVTLLSADDLPWLRGLVGEARTWALVDVLAGDVVGAIVVRDPTAANRLDEWAADPDFWVRRAALLSTLVPVKRGESLDRLFRYAGAMLEEREFFIRKAIGWVLREVAKRRPALVAEWLRPRVHLASGVTVREAVKPLPAPVRSALMAGYRDKTPVRWKHVDRAITG
jgi:3-methyladenine DNA glycosylase AlkD